MSNAEKPSFESSEYNDKNDEFLNAWFALDAESRRASRPDIFANPNEDIIKTNISNYLEKINPATLREIFNEHHDNFKDCNEAVAQYLSSILELTEPPSITHTVKDDDSSIEGTYSPHPDNELTFYYEEGRAEAVTFEDLDTIAHEMWHAHQYSVIDEDELDSNSELYKKNFDDYIDSSEDYHGYMTQLVEVEARAFASSFVENCYSAINENKDIRRQRARKLARKILPIYLATTMLATAFSFGQDITKDEKNHDKNLEIEEPPRIEASPDYAFFDKDVFAPNNDTIEVEIISTPNPGTQSSSDDRNDNLELNNINERE